MADQPRIRTLLVEQLDGKNAHADFERAINDVPFNKLGVRPEGLPHSIWELAEHIRIAQFDILDFCQNPDYEALDWPDDYWPSTSEPADESAWNHSLQQFKDDHQAMIELIQKTKNDLLKPLPHGDGQTLFREALLIVDHNAYHIGQIIQVRRLLGEW